MALDTRLTNVNSTLMPPTLVGPIFKKAKETSAVMQLARRVPLSVTAQTAIPVPMDVPTAGWVTEGGLKPVASEGVGIKMMTGKKVALIIPVSEEVVNTNPGGILEQLSEDLPTAISRAFDYAAIHGLDLKTGGAGPFTDYLAQTPYSQVIGATSAANGGAFVDLVKGLQQVVNGPTQGYDFSGFAADPRLKPELMLSVDSQGRPLWVDTPQNGLNGGNLIGYPAYYNTGVSGKYYRQGNTVQTVTLVGTPTGGTFTVTIGGQTTAGIAYNATGATVTTAVHLLSGSEAANLTVTGSGGGPYTFTFAGPASQVTVNQTALTGGTAAASLATIAQSPVSDSGLRAIGGDFSQCAYGVGSEISVRRSTEAPYTLDGGTTWHSAFQENMVLFLVEAYYGFVVGDPTAFVAYTHAAGS